VGKRFPNGTVALQDVSFQLEPGEFVFLSGPSGAGKTTLIRLLLRMDIATDGDVLAFGRNLRALRQSSLPFLRRNIGVIFQDFRLLPDRTVFENVAVGLHILGLSGREVRRRVEGILYDLGIDRYADAYPAMLSGGEQQRVAVGRALVMQPALILADEPTGNLDWELSQEIVRVFESLNSQGATVLMATHDRFLLDAFRKRTLLLNRGFLVEDRNPADGSADSGAPPDIRGAIPDIEPLEQMPPPPPEALEESASQGEESP
jgi:cell division transport system ATP-binding protein